MVNEQTESLGALVDRIIAERMHKHPDDPTGEVRICDECDTAAAGIEHEKDCTVGRLMMARREKANPTSGPVFDIAEVRGGTVDQRAERALQQIEGAQELLAAAARSLSPIIGAAPQHRQVMKLYGSVKNYWYRLDAKIKAASGKWKLDSGGRVP